jgi:Phage tail assembly chaperone protein
VEQVSINVEAAIAQRLHREAEYLDQLAADADDELVKRQLEARARVTHAAVAQAINAATSLDNDTDPATLEPVTTTPLDDEEIAAREADAETNAWFELRVDRDRLLRASDWTQLADAPEGAREAWAAYRQALRDLPAKTKNVAEPNWPEPPD